VRCPAADTTSVQTEFPLPGHLHVCGAFHETPGDWRVRATFEYAASALALSEAGNRADLTIAGGTFAGDIALTATFTDDPHVSLETRLLASDGTTIGLAARRFSVVVPKTTPARR
jgi:hypothetical protein